MLAQLLQSLYICTLYSCEQRRHSDRDGSVREFASCFFSRAEVKKPIGRAVATPPEFVTVVFPREGSVKSDVALYTAAESDQISYGTYTELRQNAAHCGVNIQADGAYTTGAFSITFHRSIQKQLQCCKTIELNPERRVEPVKFKQ